MAETWRDTNYTYRQPCTLQHANVDGDLSNVPCLFQVTIPTAKIQADLDDLRFYDGSGNLLKHYVFDQTTSGANYIVAGELKKPNLYTSPSGTDNQVWAYYGYASAVDAEDPANVYDANTECVLHLHGAAVTDIDDATSNNIDLGSATGTVAYNQAGLVGKCVHLDGTGSFLSYTGGSFPTAPTALTAFVVAKEDAQGKANVGLMAIAQSAAGWVVGRQTDNDSQFVKLGSAQHDFASAPMPGDTWCALAMTYDDTANTVTAASHDGTTYGTDSQAESASMVAWAGNFYVGSYYTTSNCWDGWIEFVEVSSVVRSAAWIKWWCSNWLTADHEQTWGAEEEQPAGGSNKAKFDYYYRQMRAA